MSKYKTNIPEADFKNVAAMFKALSNPYRLRIYKALIEHYTDGPVEETMEEDANCQREFSTLLELAPSTVSHHFKELRQAGLIHKERKGKNVLFWVDTEAVELMKDFIS
ncbi:helix-turn-helix transcriptional regulator [Desulfovibrio sp. JC010]|uniref:ArsR/SmtB family transcription factor n=1 Tax=Desulfovibrio sp. JC010 TaxID=2593641 RepID=UPI0013D5F790|nr:metalloregulator ArsR/SmtB family transcription factor [Desulfovibrio sp. JC010]NDV27548.1 winged helix-turn-helix transcriptional regulator [Desulfovibrio sp. JC010]